MPRYTRRVHRRPSTAALTDSELIGREIVAEEHRRQHELHETGRRWAGRMLPLYWAGQALFLLVVCTAARDPIVAVFTTAASTVVNAAAAYALSRGAIVAPDRFPVRYVRGFGGRHHSAADAGLSLLAFIGSVFYALH
jgi:hypothetical protein